MNTRIKLVFTLAIISVCVFLEGNFVKQIAFDQPDSNLSYAEYQQLRMADPSTGKIPDGIRLRELAFAKRLPANFSRSLTWDLIGPKSLGGRTRGIGMDIRNENIIIAGGVTGGIWRSADGGQTFVKVTDPTTLQSITCIVQDTRPGHEDTWYAGSGEYYGVVSGASFSAQFSGNGILKSTDNGSTWSPLTSTQSNTPQTYTVNGDMDFIWKIVIDQSNTSQDVVLAAIYNGVMRSTDGGTTWTPVLAFDTTTTATSDYVDLIASPTGVFYAALSSDGIDKGIWRSIDGVNWVKIDQGLPGTYNRIAMAMNPQNENEVMFIMESPGSGLNNHSLFKYTYLSGDGSGVGGQWENRSANIPNGSCPGFFTFDFGYFASQGGYDLHITWHPKNQNIVFLGGTSLYRSNDQFTTPAYKWIGGYQCDQSNLANYVYPNHHPDQHGLIFLPSDSSKAISISDGGIHKSNNILLDSVLWTSLNNGYITSQFYTISLEEGDVANDFTTAGAQDNGLWFTNRRHVDSLWKWVYRGDGSYSGIPNGRPYYIFSIQQGKMYKMFMTDDGDTLGGTRIDPTGGPSNYNFINAFILDPYNVDRLYLAARVRIWRNDSLSYIPNLGDIYNTISTGWTSIAQSQIGIADGVITVVEISKNAPDIVYYGTSKSKLYKLSNAASASPVKTEITGSIFPSNAYISAISANPFDENELMVTFSNYGIPSIFYSNDGGVNWTDVSGNLEQNPDGSGDGPAVFWTTIYPVFNTPIYFVGTSIGLFSTTSLQGGATVWTQEGPATIGNAIVNMIKARTSDGKIVVATHGNGIFASQLTPTFVSVNETAKTDLQLSSYPNPFSEVITCDLIIPQAGALSVCVYDLQGRKVKTLLNQNVGAGNRRLLWYRDNEMGAKVSQGTYIISIVQNDKKISKKIIVR